MLTRQISNHYVVHVKLIQHYMPSTPQVENTEGVYLECGPAR